MAVKMEGSFGVELNIVFLIECEGIWVCSLGFGRVKNDLRSGQMVSCGLILSGIWIVP